MRDKKRRMLLHSMWDHTGLEAHFARMAEKGWMVDKITNWGLVYRRIEPKKLTFCVCYYPKVTAFTPEPAEGQETFYDFCQHTGWELAASWAQIQVFCNERETPIPIETDPALELDTIHRSMKRGALLGNILLLLVTLLQVGLLIVRLRQDPIGLLAEAGTFFTGMCWTLVLLITGSEIAAYYRWRSKAKKAAERGEFLATNSRIGLQVVCLVIVGVGLAYYILSVVTSGDQLMMVIMLLMFLGMGLMMLLVNVLKEHLKRRKVSAKVNVAVTLAVAMALSFALIGGITAGMIAGMNRGWFSGGRDTYQYHGSVFTVYADEMPLTLEELTGAEYGENDYVRELRDSASLLLAQYTARQHPRFDAEDYIHLPVLAYTVTQVKFPSLYNLCKNALLAEYDGSDEFWPISYRPIDPGPWGAAEAYRVAEENGDPWNIYLLCYPDRLVEFRPDWEMTEAQMALAGEKLG